LSHNSEADISHDTSSAGSLAFDRVVDRPLPFLRLRLVERALDRPVRADRCDFPERAVLLLDRALAAYTEGAGVPTLANQQSLPFGLHFCVSVGFNLTTLLPFGLSSFVTRALSKCGILNGRCFGIIRMCRADCGSHGRLICRSTG
jgi:hypothetical protein